MSATGAGVAAPWPLELRVARGRRTLTVTFDDGAVFTLPAELLRVCAPSADVQGHGGGPPPPPPAGKAGVAITAVEPVGNYAVRLVFDDGHRLGLFSWALLRRFGETRDALMADYLARLGAAGRSRDP